MMTINREIGTNNPDNGVETGGTSSEEDKSQRHQLPRAKRISNAHESSLPQIEETEECRRDEDIEDEDESVFEEQQTSRWRTSEFAIFQTEIEHESPESERGLQGGVRLEGRNSTHKRIRSSEEISLKGDPNRIKAESRIAHVGDIDSAQTPETNKTRNTSHTRLHSCSESSKSSLCSIPKLDVRNVDSLNLKNVDNREDLNLYLDKKGQLPYESKLPRTRCVHNTEKTGQDRGEKCSKTVKFKGDRDKCMLCDITDDATRHAQDEANKLLLDLVYPHEFYDRYSRARHSRKSSTINHVVQKEPIAICKPAKVIRKVTHNEKTWNRLPQSTSKVPEESVVLQYHSTPEKKRKQEEHTEDEEVIKKDIHGQCKPKMNALVITENTRGQKMVLKGLKGWILRKHDELKNNIHPEMKQSLYQVSTLGMKFGLPEYNNSLHDRKPMSPRPVTCLTSRTQDNGVILRPNTHNLGPRQRTMPVFTRDMSDQSRGFAALQRDLTNIPNRLPSSAQESSSKNIVHVQNINPPPIYSPRYLETVIAKTMKAGLSLPPITSDVISPTPASLGHTQT